MKKIVFICTGNTCRSPMAEGMFNALAEKYGLDAHAVSCGYAVFGASRSNPMAVKAASDYGVDISGHISTRLTADLTEGADRVLCMTGDQAELLSGLGTPARKLAVSDIEDPYGGAQKEYERAAEQIARAVESLVKELLEDD